MAEMILKKRPKYLDVTRIRLPLPGRVSILHRVSGVGLFLMLPFLIWLFQSSVISPRCFQFLMTVVANPFVKILLTGLLWAYLHHFCAGIRFLLLDVHVGINLAAARRSAAAVLVVSLVLTLVLGKVLIW